jgi:hypothetical protein
MYRSKLVALIKELAKEDIEPLSRFLASPYFNRNDNVVKLFDIIKREYPDYTSPNLQRDVVFALIFPGKDPKGTNLTQLMSELNKLIKQFLEQENYQKSNSNKRMGLIYELIERNQMDLLKIELDEEEKRLKSGELKEDENLFYLQHQLALANYTYDMRTQNRNMAVTLNKSLDATDAYIVLLKLRALIAVITRQNAINQSYNVRLKDAIIEIINQKPLCDIILIQMYYRLYECLVNTEKVADNYAQLGKLIKTNAHKVSSGELLQFYKVWLNYELKRNKERADNAQEIYQLLKDMEINGMFSKHINKILYICCVKFAAQVNETEWAKYILDKYKNNISVDDDDDMIHTYNYAKAIWHFYKGEFKDAKNLLGMNYPDAHFYVERKFFMLKIYYNLATDKADDEMEKEIKNTLVYIDRSKAMTPSNAEACRNFLNLFKKLIKIKNKYVQNFKMTEKYKDELEKLAQELKKTSPVYDGKWLENTIENILLNHK